MKLKSKQLREINRHPNWDEEITYDSTHYYLTYVQSLGWQLHNATLDLKVISTDSESRNGLFPSRLDALLYIEQKINGYETRY